MEASLEKAPITQSRVSVMFKSKSGKDIGLGYYFKDDEKSLTYDEVERILTMMSHSILCGLVKEGIIPERVDH